LKNGNTLTGMVNYNFVIDQVKYKNNDRPEQNFSPVSVAHFLLYDDGRKKKFHSLPTDLNFKGKRLNGKETYSFFQEVHRNGKYMVLTKHLVEMQNGGFGTLVQGVPGPSINLAKEKVTEFVYIADRNQRITSILKRKKSKDRSLIGVGLTGISDDIFASNYSQKLELSNTEKIIDRYYFTNKRNLKDALSSDFAKFQNVMKERDWDIKTMSGFVNTLRLTAE